MSESSPLPPESATTPEHIHKSVGIFSRGTCTAPRVRICACGATQRVGEEAWRVPPNPRSFDALPPEQREELRAYSDWLRLPKPKVAFEVYRAEHLSRPAPPSLPRPEPLRCLITRNPVGTDTRPVGRPCPCANCSPVGSPRGEADEELKEALDAFAEAYWCNEEHQYDRESDLPEKRRVVESLFSRIREERDEALVEVKRLHALSLRLRA